MGSVTHYLHHSSRHFSLLPDRPQHLLRRDRQIINPHAHRILDRVGDRRRHGNDRRLADAHAAVWTIAHGKFLNHGL